MEQITYRITLDAHKNGIQRTLQGFETSDKLSRKVVVNLMENGDTYEIPKDHVVAAVYVTTPSANEPSINECTIEGNTVVYDVLPIVEEGITEMQIKLIESRPAGAKKVLVSARFAVEVAKSHGDEGAEQTQTFTALENALASALSVYNGRLMNIEIDDTCMFRAYYADGSVYESDALNKVVYTGDARLARSWAIGGTGMRDDEDTNNSMYYSKVSKSAALDANNSAEKTEEILAEAIKRTTYTIFQVDYEAGDLIYLTSNYDFSIDPETGELEVDGGKNYTPEDLVGEMVDEFIDMKSQEIDYDVREAKNIAKGKNMAKVFNTTEEMIAWLSNEENKGECSVGDNLYILSVAVPDWWVSEVLEEVDEETGWYYKISQLETQKVDVNEIITELGVRFNQETGFVEVYNADEWVEWKQTGLVQMLIYKNGNTFSEITGGYEKVKLDDNMQMGTATFDPNLDGSIYTTFTNNGIRLQTVNKNIDLSLYSKMEVDYSIVCTGNSAASNYAKFSLISESGTVLGVKEFTNTEMDADPNGTVTIDISGDRQKAYFELLSTYSGTATINITRIAFIR